MLSGVQVEPMHWCWDCGHVMFAQEMKLLLRRLHFFATAEAIAAIGAIPVFVDIKQDDYTIDPDKIEEVITDKTKANFTCAYFGAVCDMDRINEIAKGHGLKVIEDDAQAIGSEYKGRKAGTLGDVGCFSFYPTKKAILWSPSSLLTHSE